MESPISYKFATNGFDFEYVKEFEGPRGYTFGTANLLSKRITFSCATFYGTGLFMDTYRNDCIFNARQTMYHEMSHCVDYSLLSKAQIKKLESCGNLLELRKVLDDIHSKAKYGICSKRGFNTVMEKDMEHQKNNGYRVEEISQYGAQKGDLNQENWAELGSMVVLEWLYEQNPVAAVEDRVLDDAVLRGYVGDPYTNFNIAEEHDYWMKAHPNAYKWGRKIFDNLKPTEYTYHGVKPFLDKMR